MNIEVIKRDGSKEPFSSDKIRRVVMAAGLPSTKVPTLIDAIESWIQTLEVTEVNSLAIRDKVHEELVKLDPYASNMYGWYQKTKDK